MAALLLASTTAFVSKPVTKPQLRPARQPTRVAPTAAMPQVVATAVAALPKAVCALKLPTIRQLAAAPALYALMSINEYFTHKYYQHAEFNTSPWFQWLARTFVYGPLGKKVPKTRGGGHVEHHAETLDDMTLKTDAKWRSTKVAKSLDDDLYRGTAFTWTVTGIMTFQMLWTTIPTFWLMGYKLKHTFMCLAPGMLLHAAVWNALHPNMHSLPDIPISDGVPSSWLAWARSSKFFKFLYVNHEGHHVIGGKGNYNVCCPLTDHLVGTFIPEKAWRPRARSTYASFVAVSLCWGAFSSLRRLLDGASTRPWRRVDGAWRHAYAIAATHSDKHRWHGEELSVEQQIKNHIARESFGLGEVQIAPGAKKGDAGGAAGWVEKAELLAA